MREGHGLPLLRFVPTTAIAFACLGPAAAGCDHALRGGENHGGSTGRGGGPSGEGASGSGGMGGTGGVGARGGSPERSVGGAGGFTAVSVQPRTSCGDRIVQRSEWCDDGNTQSGDGCSSECRIEFGWKCPREGEPCISARTCGDSILMPDEACDDGNTLDGDGCSSDCQHLERGWYCRVPGRPCRPVCGDGLIVGEEACDDGNTMDGDGCSSVYQREVCYGSPTETGWPCDPRAPRPYCGDGILGPCEECDCGSGVTVPTGCASGNDDGAYNGCTTRCKWGPYCGDGVVDVILGEECDLGSARNGVPLDAHFDPAPGAGNIFCTRDCRYAFVM